jgi:hypothetical protein
MSPSSFLRLVRHPATVALRLLLWPAAILLLSNGAGALEDDALAGGLLTFAVLGMVAFLLALADGLVLRSRWLVLVWSVTTLVLAALLSLQPVVDLVLHGPAGTTTWTETVRLTLDDLPSTLTFFFFLAGVPVALGAVTGYALQRSARLRGAQGGQPTALGVPRT